MFGRTGTRKLVWLLILQDIPKGHCRSSDLQPAPSMSGGVFFVPVRSSHRTRGVDGPHQERAQGEVRALRLRNLRTESCCAKLVDGPRKAVTSVFASPVSSSLFPVVVRIRATNIQALYKLLQSVRDACGMDLADIQEENIQHDDPRSVTTTAARPVVHVGSP